MKAQDLRLGNFLTYNGKVISVWAVSSDDVVMTSENDLGYTIEYLKPIPLTEEWLVRLGFFSKYKSCHTHWYNGGFSIDQKSDEDDLGNKIPVEQVFYYNFRIDVKYVHQLQNLYFALTGTELTLS